MPYYTQYEYNNKLMKMIADKLAKSSHENIRVLKNRIIAKEEIAGWRTIKSSICVDDFPKYKEDDHGNKYQNSKKRIKIIKIEEGEK